MDAATLHFLLKERLAVPKKLLACNTKLKLHDPFIGYSENEAQLEAFEHPTKLKPFFCPFSLFLTCSVAVFPFTHLGFTHVKRVV